MTINTMLKPFARPADLYPVVNVCDYTTAEQLKHVPESVLGQVALEIDGKTILHRCKASADKWDVWDKLPRKIVAHEEARKALIQAAQTLAACEYKYFTKQRKNAV